MKTFLIGTLGWTLGLATILISSEVTRSYERRDVARLLLSEVQFNNRVAKLFSTVDKSDLLNELKDEKGKPVPFAQPKMLPGSFSFSVFDATLERQARLDGDLLDTLHSFYRLLRQAERYRDVAESDKAPDRSAGFIKDVFSSGTAAAKVAEDRKLLERLEKVASESLLRSMLASPRPA